MIIITSISHVSPLWAIVQIFSLLLLLISVIYINDDNDDDNSIFIRRLFRWHINV